MASKLGEAAAAAMHRIDRSLSERFCCVIEFLDAERDLANTWRLEFGSPAYLAKAAQSFANGRRNQRPCCPATAPDPMVRVVMESFFGVSPGNSADAVSHHNYAMGAENIIGYLLECYIAQALESKGWTWCTGSVVKAVDFIHRGTDGIWTALQVKNRDNSENSSSKAIRNGTNILHWFRTFSRKGGTNWANFPNVVTHSLSEEGFKAFTEEYLAALA